MLYYTLYTLLIGLTIYALVRSYRIVMAFYRLSGVILLVMLSGLFINFILLALGDLIFAKDTLCTLSRVRFALQLVMGPFAVIAGTETARRFKTSFLEKKRIVATAWIFTLTMVALGIKYQFNYELEEILVYGHIRFEPVARQELYLISATIGFILLFISLLVYADQQYALMFGVILVVMIGFAIMRLISGNNIFIIHDMLDWLLLAGLHKADKDSYSAEQIRWLNEGGTVRKKSSS